MLSGQDLPIKNNEYINKFFEEEKGKEFIDMDPGEPSKITFSKIKLYHFLQEKLQNKNKILKKIYYVIEKMSLIIQNIFKIDRTKKYKNIKFAKGANWFSITDELAKYVLESESKIKELYKYTLCCDEIFLQTLVENSKFKERVSDKGCLRYIVWEDGKHPNIFKNENYEELVNSDCLFARKFDENVDNEIIDKIYNKLKGNSYK